MLKYETDSRKVKPGQIFVAIKGHTVDGHDFVEAAIKNGATAVVVQNQKEYDVETIHVEDTEKYLREHLVYEYQKKLSSLRLIGVTGTNGKTTTCYLAYQLLKKLGVKVAYMGTIGFYYEDDKIELPNTTPDILRLYDLLLNALDKGCTTVVMEVSSHAIYYERIAGLRFEIGGFTNLTEDHLDFHKTMEEYLQAKVKLLNSMKEDGAFLVNSDDEHSEAFEKRFPLTKEIGLNGKDYHILDYHFTPAETTLKVNIENKEYTFSYHLTGKFNVYNMLFAIAIAHSYGFDLKTILDQVKEVYPPKGRCETIRVFDSFAVVDYAHTPDAVEKVVDCYLELAEGKIITVVGCGGDRDPLKRPIMGRIATEKSDYVIFTDDNPRTEDERKIMDDILKGVNKTNYEVILDRHQAIKRALELLKPNDIALILGKGHEDYQILGHEKVHFDDREEIERFIQERSC